MAVVVPQPPLVQRRTLLLLADDIAQIGKIAITHS
jgi:hypothetical protein